MSWTELKLELKQDIIGLVDYETRCHLRLCSKSDKDTVDSTKITVKHMKIWEIRSEMVDDKTIIRIDIDSFTIWFIGRENVTRINRGWNGEVIEELSEMKQVNRYELVTQFFHRIIRNRFVKAETLEIDNLMFPPPESFNIKTDNLFIHNLDNDLYIEWLRKCITPCRKFKQFKSTSWRWRDGITELLSQIQATESFKLKHDIEITDEQLDKIEAVDLRVYSLNITLDGARRKFERFLKFGRQSDKFELHFPLPENFDAVKQLFSEELIVKRSNMENGAVGEFHGKIIGGFKNIHGIQSPRDINCMVMGLFARIYCVVYKKPERNFYLYPFE